MAKEAGYTWNVFVINDAIGIVSSIANSLVMWPAYVITNIYQQFKLSTILYMCLDICRQTLSVLRSEQFPGAMASNNCELWGTDNIQQQIYIWVYFHIQ